MYFHIVLKLPGEKVATQEQLQLERGVRICERNSPADTKISEGRGGGGAPAARAEIPLLLAWEVHSGAGIHLQLTEDHVNVHKGNCDPMGAHAAEGSWQDLRPCGERSPPWSRFAGRTCDPVGDPHWSRLFLKDCTLWKGHMVAKFMKNCSPWEGLALQKFMEDCLPWEGPLARTVKECEESPP
ncbi:hypothetical protein DUI87_08327 [Hirundo rustica rustica]|uniref:Uncharacterized protein n=1 Tax=Hirundo rustica rustica TaxID=333673 RepID=A0A3M0KS52_HIRRU|nr:hypothetical protein DUI87_08327 [Hirundo rustica rustica]